jgi:hypothetical protein
MHGSDRLLIATAVGCLILAAIGLSDTKERQHDAARTNYAEKRVNQIETPRAGLPFAAESFVSNPEPKNTDEREKRDLAAQEASATWAFWVVLFAAVQTILTVVGIYFVKRTLDATLRAVEDTGQATEAMREANQISRDAMNAQYRPRVHIDVRGPVVDPGQLNQFKDGEGNRLVALRGVATFENLGTDAVTLIQASIWAEIERAPRLLIERNKILKPNKKAMIGWNAENAGLPGVPDSVHLGYFVLSPENRNAFMRDPLLIRGIIHYSNVLDEIFEHSFLFSIKGLWSPTRASLIDSSRRKLTSFAQVGLRDQPH